jgi:2,4-dienoyl-CoA reductase-like NADH-dependent reductase (Old Yellow Enzyme family)
MRFLREVIDAIRSEVGERMALGIRISGDELNHQVLVPDEVVAICAALDADGCIDFIDVCGGSMSGLGGAVHVVPPTNLTPGYLAPVAARVRAVIAFRSRSAPTP